MQQMKLSECLRWLVTDSGERVLQALETTFKEEGGSGQGRYKHKWINIPLVISGKFLSELKPIDLAGEDEGHEKKA